MGDVLEHALRASKTRRPRRWIGHDPIRSAGQQLVYQRRGEPLLEAVARGAIVQRGHSDSIQAWRQPAGASGDVIAATAQHQRPSEGSRRGAEPTEENDYTSFFGAHLSVPRC